MDIQELNNTLDSLAERCEHKKQNMNTINGVAVIRFALSILDRLQNKKKCDYYNWTDVQNSWENFKDFIKLDDDCYSKNRGIVAHVDYLEDAIHELRILMTAQHKKCKDDVEIISVYSLRFVQVVDKIIYNDEDEDDEDDDEVVINTPYIKQYYLHPDEDVKTVLEKVNNHYFAPVKFQIERVDL